jgi:hypothetical protein
MDLAILSVSVVAVACCDDRLSGPEAQAAFTEAGTRLNGIGEGVIVFLRSRSPRLVHPASPSRHASIIDCGRTPCMPTVASNEFAQQ